MMCPHCSIGEIAEDTRRCTVCGQAAPDRPAGTEPLLDDIVARELGTLFHLERPVKRGPRSGVYFARDAEIDREIALKVIPRRATMPAATADRFQHEARIAARLDHAHIVRPYRHGTTDSLLWCATERVSSPSLAERLAERGPLDLSETLRLVQQVGSALDYAHRRGVAHGALKPRDILVDDAGWVRIVDMAIARALGPLPANPQSDEDVRALAYHAPEHFAALTPVGPPADQWALAHVVRECLTGMPPTEQEISDVPPTAPPYLGPVLRRATARRPADRFPAVLEFIAALSGSEGTTRPLAFAARTPRRAPPRQVLLLDPPSESWSVVPRRPLVRASLGIALMAAGAALWLSRDSVWDPTGVLASPPRAEARSSALPASDTARVADPPPGNSARDEPARPAPPPVRTPAATPPAPRSDSRPAAPRASAPAPVRRAAASGPGFLSVNSRPWAELSVDDRVVGNTPQVKIRVAPGLHHLLLVREGFQSYEAWVEVTAGDTVRITDITLKEIAP